MPVCAESVPLANCAGDVERSWAWIWHPQTPASVPRVVLGPDNYLACTRIRNG